MSRLRFREPSPRFPEISPSRRRSPAQATNGVRRLLKSFAANIRNRNTREAYYRAACSFFAWLKQNDITELDDIEPMRVSLCEQTPLDTAAKPTVERHLAGIRHLFDWLVTGQILPANPAHAVRGPKHVVRRGKTPFLTEDQARRPLADIDSSTVVGPRDRALIGMMAYTFARTGAVVGIRVKIIFPGERGFTSASARKAASSTRCQCITNSKSISRSRRPASGKMNGIPLPHGCGQNGLFNRERNAPHRRLRHDPAPHS